MEACVVVIVGTMFVVVVDGINYFNMVWLGLEEIGGAPVWILCNYITGKIYILWTETI